MEIAGTVVAGCTIDPSRGELFHARRGAGAFARRSGVGGRGGGGGWGGGGARKSVPENQPLRVSAARGEPQAPLGESQAALDESQAAPGEPQAAPGDRPLRVSSARELSQAVVCTGFPYDRREQLPWMLQAFARFTELSQGTRRLGSAALDLAFVAAGRLDGFWEQGLKPWDVAAGQVLVEEAGGLVTRYDGSRHDLDSGQILAAGGEIHAAMQRVLQAGRPD